MTTLIIVIYQAKTPTLSACQMCLILVLRSKVQIVSVMYSLIFIKENRDNVNLASLSTTLTLCVFNIFVKWISLDCWSDKTRRLKTSLCTFSVDGSPKHTSVTRLCFFTFSLVWRARRRPWLFRPSEIFEETAAVPTVKHRVSTKLWRRSLF